MKKTISFALLHFSVSFAVVYLLTGSFILGGAVALIEPSINTIVYHFHEKFWQAKNLPSESMNVLIT